MKPSPKKEIRWNPRLIRRLRGKRSQAQFGLLVRATTNTIWRWEDGRSQPDEQHSLLLSEVAARERFLDDWQLARSGILVGDLDHSLRKLSEQLRRTVESRSVTRGK